MITMGATRARLVWLDAARGLAVVAMVIFHLIWDLAHFGYIGRTIPWSTPVKLFGHSIAFSFLFIAGYSLAVANRGGMRWPAFWRRFAIIAGAAALVSAGTYIVFPNAWVFFGILHVIATASLAAIPFRRAPWPVTAAAGLAALAAPWVVASAFFDADWLIWLGLGEREPVTQDWRPFFPWTGALLLGVAAGRLPLSEKRAGMNGELQARTNEPIHAEKGLSFLGRHSLIIYLAHQPALFTLFTALAYVAPPPVDTADFVAACEAQCVSEGGVRKTCGAVCKCTGEEVARTKALDGVKDKAERAQRLNAIARGCLNK